MVTGVVAEHAFPAFERNVVDEEDGLFSTSSVGVGSAWVYLALRGGFGALGCLGVEGVNRDDPTAGEAGDFDGLEFPVAPGDGRQVVQVVEAHQVAFGAFCEEGFRVEVAAQDADVAQEARRPGPVVFIPEQGVGLDDFPRDFGGVSKLGGFFAFGRLWGFVGGVWHGEAGWGLKRSEIAVDELPFGALLFELGLAEAQGVDRGVVAERRLNQES